MGLALMDMRILMKQIGIFDNYIFTIILNKFARNNLLQSHSNKYSLKSF